jgi:hypothetical protein
MPPVIIIIAGAAALGYALDKGAEAADATARATKWGIAAGGLYIAYRAAQTGGLIR